MYKSSVNLVLGQALLLKHGSSIFSNECRISQRRSILNGLEVQNFQQCSVSCIFINTCFFKNCFILSLIISHLVYTQSSFQPKIEEEYHINISQLSLNNYPFNRIIIHKFQWPQHPKIAFCLLSSARYQVSPCPLHPYSIVRKDRIKAKVHGFPFSQESKIYGTYCTMPEKMSCFMFCPFL